MNRDELVFSASRFKASLLLLGSILFVVLGWWMKEQKPLIGWLCVVFFSLGVPAALTMFLPGVMSLRLDPEGLEMKSLGRTNTIRWSDVQSFRIGSIRGAKMIAIQYRPQYAEQKFARSAASAISGMEGAIPNSYNVPLVRLETVLNEWLERFGRQADLPSTPRG
jgi:hypothetical protein